VAGTNGAARIAAVIPAYDAARTLATVVADVRAAWGNLGDIIVVDDGSSDATREIGAANGAVVVSHDRNFGKGRALRSGLHEAFERGHRAAVTIDADGQHPADEAARLATYGDDHGALVLGIRDLAGAGAPRPNQISNAISNGFLSLFSRKVLRDTQCGLRRYPLPLALSLSAKDDGYAFEAEIILLAIAAGAPVIEVPIRVVYPEDRTTHFDSVRDPMRVVGRVVKTLVSTRGITRRARA
jgi:glycosyltransferase involved in cell wall biosynthesis